MKFYYMHNNTNSIMCEAKPYIYTSEKKVMNIKGAFTN